MRRCGRSRHRQGGTRRGESCQCPARVTSPGHRGRRARGLIANSTSSAGHWLVFYEPCRCRGSTYFVDRGGQTEDDGMNEFVLGRRSRTDSL